MAESFKRETAHKIRIGDIIRANKIFDESGELNKRLRFIELGKKQIQRINLVANVVDKFESEGERRFASITLDDGSGQIRARLFGEDTKKFSELIQGDTVIIIGVLRAYNQEVYILPEIIRKESPKYLLVRKIEIEKSFPQPVSQEQKNQVQSLREEILGKIKKAEANEGIEKEELVMGSNARPNLISQEIQKLLEEGIIYEPRPGRVRYLG